MYKITGRQILVIALASALFAVGSVMAVQQLWGRLQPLSSAFSTSTPSNLTDPSLPRMGERLRLKASFDISRFPSQARAVLKALKRYGMIVADNGSDWYISGAPSSHWSNDQLHTLGQVPGSAFDVVDTSSLPHPGG